jgi:ribosomal protein L31E
LRVVPFESLKFVIKSAKFSVNLKIQMSEEPVAASESHKGIPMAADDVPVAALWKQQPASTTTTSTTPKPDNSQPSRPMMHSRADDAVSVASSETSRHMELKKVEQEIDRNVFNSLSKRKQKRFKRTVMSIHAIVTHKLYKAKASSLEVYFKDSWNISRAQVYRFLDCAWVLKVRLYLLFNESLNFKL